MWRSTWRLARCGDMWRGRAAGRGDVWGGCGMRRGDARGRDMWRWRGNMWSRRNMRGRGRARRSRRVRPAAGEREQSRQGGDRRIEF